MIEANRNLAVRWFEEVWNQGRREAIPEMLTADALIHDGATVAHGPEGFYAFFDQMHSAFSDMHVEFGTTIVEGDLVCIRWSITMKHTGDALSMPASGKTVSTTGISIARVNHGRIAEAWQNWDMVGLLGQIQESASADSIYIGAARHVKA